MKPDFSGWATKAGIKCSDGRTIMPDAFKNMDGKTVPLVWQHGHDKPENVLGHAILEARPEGVYCQGFFNETPFGKQAKALVEHKDVASLSIWANGLIEKAKQVFHGTIREVSLVLSGANPGAFIDNIVIQHSDDVDEVLADTAIIYSGVDLQHSDAGVDTGGTGTKDTGSTDADPTVEDIYNSFTPEQKDVVHLLLGEAIDSRVAAHQNKKNKAELIHTTEGTEDMTGRRNLFERNGKEGGTEEHVIAHDAMKGIFEDAKSRGSLKAAVEEYALQHGIDNIDTLFPNYKDIDQTPQFLSRRMEWVAGVIDGTSKRPFSRIRSRWADITMEEARARGYIKGTMKKEEFFSVARRTTGPTTVYKKQKLDRDDIIDITDFDVVMWMKAEMRIMLEEEIARAILIGDGREVDNPDKVKDPMGANDGLGIRSILNDHELYVTHVNVQVAADNTTWNSVVEAVLLARRFYKGAGNPAFYTTNEVATRMLLAKDGFGRRLYNNKAELASALNVSSLVEVEVMETLPDVLGIIVNLSDYVIGTDKGGEVNFFDFFDIDFNQYKYLDETRLSGALVTLKSAMVVHRVAGSDVLIPEPTAPAYNASTHVLTIPTDANVDYFADGDPVDDADTITLDAGDSIVITAKPIAGKYFAEEGNQTTWTFSNPVRT
jgi:hypothetical protein